MAGIVESGTGRNLTNEVVGDTLRPDPTERKFVTFVNELGGVHTIIVAAEHAAQDGEALYQWFEHTRALITTSHSVDTNPAHRTPDQVIATANERMGFGGKDADAPADPTQHTTSQQG